MAEQQLSLSNLKPAQPRRERKRVGRGQGSGKGRYSGRGIKGQKSRSGSKKMRPGFEGGQMPIYMRVGKQRGATSKDAMPVGPFRTFTQGVNIRSLDRFDAGSEVTPESLKSAGLIKSIRRDVKILGMGELTTKLTVSAHSFSKTAKEKIEAAGGKVIWLRGEPAAKRPVRAKRGPVEGARGNREVPSTDNEAAETPVEEAEETS
jgi:large subunit ribosomal protein L15